jgi:hypothetical protein
MTLARSIFDGRDVAARSLRSEATHLGVRRRVRMLLAT